jgi:hypothetical protein
MKHLVGKTITEKVPFMGDEVEVKKMTVGEILDMQKLINSAAKSKKEDAQIGLLRDIIRVAVIDAADITDEEFNTFPISELNSLSEKILELSGIGGSEGN